MAILRVRGVLWVAALSVAALAVLGSGCADKKRRKAGKIAKEAQQAAKDERWGAAVDLYKKAAELYPSQHFLWFKLGQAHEFQNEWKKAADNFGKAAKNLSDNPVYHYSRGYALFRKELDASQDQVDPNTQRIKRAARQANFAEAERSLKRASELSPNWHKPFRYLGWIKRLEGEPQQAAEYYTKACTYKPDWADAFYELGQLYTHFDQYDAAVEVLTNGIRNIASEDKKKSRVEYQLGLAYYRKAESAEGGERKDLIDKAIDAYTAAHDSDRDNLYALGQRGIAYHEKGDISSAKKDFTTYDKRRKGAKTDPFLTTQVQRRLGIIMADMRLPGKR